MTLCPPGAGPPDKTTPTRKVFPMVTGPPRLGTINTGGCPYRLGKYLFISSASSEQWVGSPSRQPNAPFNIYTRNIVIIPTYRNKIPLTGGKRGKYSSLALCNGDKSATVTLTAELNALPVFFCCVFASAPFSCIFSILLVTVPYNGNHHQIAKSPTHTPIAALFLEIAEEYLFTCSRRIVGISQRIVSHRQSYSNPFPIDAQLVAASPSLVAAC